MPQTESRARQNFSQAAEGAINTQINLELYASYVYQSVASWCSRDTVSLPGFSKYYGKMSSEEREHAQKLINYMSLRGGNVIFQEIEAPPTEWKSAIQILEEALNLERRVNQSLLDLHKVAEENDDPQLADFLEGHYLKDQVEDIKVASDLLTQLYRAGPDGLGLYLFDLELSRKAD